MISRRALLGALPGLALGAGALRWWWTTRAAPLAITPAPAAHDVLFVYNAVSANASLVLGLPGEQARLIALPSLALGRWNVRIGVIEDRLLLLDTESKRLHELSLDWLRAAAENPRLPLSAAALRTTSLHAGLVPYRALLDRGRVLVDYFAENRIEAYRWQRETGLAYVGEHVVAATRPLGLSDAVVHGERLLVAASGVSCLARICPKETAPDPHLFAFQLDREPLGALVADLHPTNVNAAGLYVHPDNAAVFVISAGEYRAGYSSLQRLRDDGSLGPEIRLASNAGAARAFRLDAHTCAILQFSGEHVLLFDPLAERVLGILRFDATAKRFVRLPAGAAPLSERFQSDLQDLLPDKTHPRRFYIVDSKREQLLHVEFQPPTTLEVLTLTSLRTAAFRSSPSWAVWLPTPLEHAAAVSGRK